MSETRTSLLRRVRDFQDNRGWIEFDRLYRPLLVRFARSRGLTGHDADEIAQQCLEIIVQRIGTFRRRKSFRGWLRRMVDNKVKQFYAQRVRHHPTEPEDVAEARAAEDPTEPWDAQWDRTHIMYCLANLRDTFASHTLRAFELYVLHDQPVEEICRQLGMSPNQVYVAKSRVIKRIQSRYARLLESLYGV